MSAAAEHEPPRDLPACPFPFAHRPGLVMPAEYERLRREEPVSRVRLPYGEDAWLVVRHRDVREVLAGPAFSRAAAVGRDAPRITPQDSGGGMLDLDPPEHTALRRVVSAAFSARRIAGLEATVTATAEELLRRMLAQGPPADLLADFALPLSVRTICALLGVPDEDHDRVASSSRAFHSTGELPVDEVGRRVQATFDHLHGLLTERVHRPGPGLIGEVAGVLAGGDGPGPVELTWLLVGLLVAGYESTATQLVNSVYLLTAEPERMRWLRGDRERIGPAVEELLRYVPLQTAGVFPRYATRDVTLGGVAIRRGDAVLVDLTSADRDGDVFADPDRLDLARPANPHVAFGHGAHHCLGAPLARLELRVALTVLLHGVADLRPAVAPQRLLWRRTSLVRGPVALPVTWTVPAQSPAQVPAQSPGSGSNTR
ncbi:cytochrome P450 [Dactylosporangium fulvum]|uniref:Cytochrome P450 n=1 Tax=Dactylosporangium fulvum TaxID=53359 RepID=A0ABY5WBQ9_9ACTN|nr:cytochrome P450 [Dactylosporangium fulvum]UWP86113.1 cytochrome P450 [Dactylosporangium fulvum]